MRSIATALVLVGLLWGSLVPAVQAQQLGEREKLAQTTMKFLSVSVDPRAAALGDAVSAREGGSMLLFYNPAGMARQEGFLTLGAAQTQWIADINYNIASLSLRPSDGRWGVFGFSLVAVDYGDIQATIRANNDQGFEDVGTISPTAFSVGVGYARALTDRFSVGGHVKYVLQDLGTSIMGFTDDGGFDQQENRESAAAFDFGMLYKTGFRSLAFAVSARNFGSREIEYEEESYQLPLTLKIGVAMDVLDLTPMADSEMHSFILSVDSESPRDFSEQIKVGGEYTFMNTVSLRAGYIVPTDEQGINLGVGLQQNVGRFGVGADYAFTNFGVFSNVHRLALRISL